MIKKYLVNIACYLNSEIKKDAAVKLIKHLRESGVDVCVTLHSNDYLSELANLANFVYFDEKNEMIKKEDIINNLDLIKEDYERYGAYPTYFTHDFGSIVDICTPRCPHSKSALSLFKAGIIVGLHHHYDWVVYLEYDLPIPKQGYKKLFEEKIQIMETQDADAFFYRVSPKHLGGIYGAPIIVKSNIILKSNLLCEDWFLSNRNWVKHWQCAYFEKTIEMILKSENKFKTIDQDIDLLCMTDWGVPRDDDFNGSCRMVQLENSQKTYEYIDYHESHYQTNLSVVYICPYKIKNSNDYGLSIYARNDGRINTDFYIKVYIDDNLVYGQNRLILAKHWFFDCLDIRTANFYSEIKLEYNIKNEKGTKKFEEKLLYKNINKIHDKLVRFEPKSL